MTTKSIAAAAACTSPPVDQDSALWAEELTEAAPVVGGARVCHGQRLRGHQAVRLLPRRRDQRGGAGADQLPEGTALEVTHVLGARAQQRAHGVGEVGLVGDGACGRTRRPLAAAMATASCGAFSGTRRPNHTRSSPPGPALHRSQSTPLWITFGGGDVRRCPPCGR